MSKSLRLGLFGGTFDPIHNGHLHLITQLLTRNVVDEIVVVPAGHPWMRSEAPHSNAEDRLEMVKLAVSGLPPEIQSRVSVSESEVRRSGPTYAIETVEEMRAEKPHDSIVLILGSDASGHITEWHRSEELLSMVELLVVARNGDGMDIDALAVSSTRIREQLAANVSVQNEVPEMVWKYIQERKLYASK